MCEKHKELLVEVKPETYERIKKFTKYLNVSEEVVMKRIIQYALDDFDVIYERLKEGYTEMGKLNLEISNEFAESENEALGHIKIRKDYS